MRANLPNAVAVFDLAYRAGLTLRVVSLIHVSLEALNMHLGVESLGTWGCRVGLGLAVLQGQSLGRPPICLAQP